MVVLLAIAFIILAFSHWRQIEIDWEESNGGGNTSVENREKNCNKTHSLCDDEIEESVIVIMVGDEQPYFLATPIVLSNHVQGE